MYEQVPEIHAPSAHSQEAFAAVSAEYIRYCRRRARRARTGNNNYQPRKQNRLYYKRKKTRYLQRVARRITRHYK